MRQAGEGSSCVAATALLLMGKNSGIMLGTDFWGSSHPGPAQGLSKVPSQGSEAAQAPRGIRRFRPYRNVWECGGKTSPSSHTLLEWPPPSVACLRSWSPASWLCRGPDKAKQAPPGKETHSSVPQSLFGVVIALGSCWAIPHVSDRKVVKNILPLSLGR